MDDNLDDFHASVAAAKERAEIVRVVREAHRKEAKTLLAYHLDRTKYVLDADMVADLVMQTIDQGLIPHVRSNY